MKQIISTLIIAIFAGLFGTSLFAQECPSDIKGNPSCPDHQLYQDQAVIRIQEFKDKIKGLEAELQALQADYAKFEKNLADTKTSLKDCNDAFYKMIGATTDDINKFRQQFGVIEGKVREMQRMSDDVLADKQDEVMALEAELNKLRGNKIAVLPEFFDKIIKLAKEINPGLIRKKKVRQYTVKSWFENKDCLWNIAGNVEIYGDPFQWPKIWQANTKIVKNPDLIHPGDVLQLPPAGPKTDDEMKAERKYWRQKRAAMENQEAKPADAAAKKGN